MKQGWMSPSPEQRDQLRDFIDNQYDNMAYKIQNQQSANTPITVPKN
jgi:hypothetical protein